MSTQQLQVSPEIQEKAADWFGRFRDENVPISETQEFLRWLKQSPQHVQAYLAHACANSDDALPMPCDRLTTRVEEPCSATPPKGSDNSTQH